MKKLKSKRSKKTYLIPIIIIFFIVVLLIFGIFFKFDFSKIMGNSVFTYYCEDETYKLSGKSCYKTVYSSSALLGDVNLDGVVSIMDVTMIQKHLAKSVELDELQQMAADVNDDNTITNDDVTQLQASLNDSTNIETGTLEAYTNNKKIGQSNVCIENYYYNKAKDSCERNLVVKAQSKTYVKGDINNDNVVDDKDVQILQEYLADIRNLSNIEKKAADYNEDGYIDIADVTLMNSELSKNNKANVTVDLDLLTAADVKNISKNTNLTYQAQFKISNNQSIYYEWYSVKSTNNVAKTVCKLAKNNHIDNFSIKTTQDNEYVLLKLYSDSKCSEEYDVYRSDNILLKKISDMEAISMNYEIVSPANLTTNILNKNTNLTFKATFDIEENNDYYFKWEAIKNNQTYNSPVCTKVTDGYTKETTLTINGKDQYGKWSIYKDSNCTNLIKTYQTDTYNYIADSIKIDKSQTRLEVGSNLNLKATVSTNLDNISNLIKWTSSNVAVAQVDNKGNVTAKKEGSATITATVGGMSATSIITVVEAGNDTSISCPAISYSNVNNVTTMNITPDSSVSKYDVYLSTNDINGSYATWKVKSKGVTGFKSINNTIDSKQADQAKIIVYSSSGTSRNCYSADLNLWSSQTISTLASCPKINYSYDKISGVSSYSYKDGKTTNVKSGVSKMYISFTLNSNYQYSWYTSQGDGSYKLFKTYKTSNNIVKDSVTAQVYNRNGKIVVTDKKGNTVICNTDYVNNLKFSKVTYGSTDLYIENGFNMSNEVKTKVNSLNTNNPQYLPTSKIFFLTDSTYNKLGSTGSCGIITSNRYIMVREKTSACSLTVGSLMHELGHGIDYMNAYLTKKDLHDTTFSYNGANKTLADYKNKYSSYKSNGKHTYLRDYAYKNNDEFWAELFAYSEKKFNVNQELKNVRAKALERYIDTYRNNKTKWKEIKDGYR